MIIFLYQGKFGGRFRGFQSVVKLFFATLTATTVRFGRELIRSIPCRVIFERRRPADRHRQPAVTL